MTIGIMTFHRADNYGAVLQAYALQEAIIAQSNDLCEIIDYQCDIIEKRYALFPHLSGTAKQKIKQIGAFLYFFGRRCKAKQVYKKFRRKYLLVSQKKYNKFDIEQANNIYQTVITGSDQVWNLMLTKNDDAYFLSWVKGKRCAYAASFGFAVIPERYQYDKWDEVVNSYKILSVRELSIPVRENNSKKMINVLDPTLLWRQDFWDKIRSHKYDSQGGKYILLYIIASGRSACEYAQKLSKEKGLPVYYINQSTHKEKGFKNLYNVSVEDFIDLIANADTVITTSYHGLCFSVLYQRNFKIGMATVKDNFNIRIETLLGHLGLRIEDTEIGGQMPILDWDIINMRLEEKREQSKKILEKIIND